MGRVRPTFPTTMTGYSHRERRSKKGRKKRKIGEDKIPLYFAAQEKDEKILKKTGKREILPARPRRGIGVLPSEVGMVQLEDQWLKEYDSDGTPSFVKKSSAFPALVCENCGYHIQLNFSAKDNPERMSTIRCKECRQPGFYAHYWTNYQLMDSAVFSFHAWIRDAIKIKKAKLLDLIL